jgi:hypothetical protein
MFLRTYMFWYVVVSVFMAGCTTTPTVDSGSVVVESEDFRAAIIFNDADRRKIKQYFDKKHKLKTLPPGLAQKDELPPGLRKHIEKYRELPPGIEGRRLPQELENTLSPLPSNYIRLQVGGDIVLIHGRTRYVLDVVFDVD